MNNLSKEKTEVLEKAVNAIKIELSAVEVEELKEEAELIESWIEPIFGLSVETEASSYQLEVKNALREDEPTRAAEFQALFNNSAVHEDGYYRVPAIMEE